MKKANLEHFAIIAGKHLCCSLFLINLQAVRPATLSKRDSNIGVFLWMLRHFQKHLFGRTSANGCFCSVCVITSISLFFKATFYCFIGKTFFVPKCYLCKNIGHVWNFRTCLFRYFVTFHLVNILNISCRFPHNIKRFQDEVFCHTNFSFLINLEIGSFSKLTFFSGDSSPMLKSCRKNIILSSALQSLYCK